MRPDEGVRRGSGQPPHNRTLLQAAQLKFTSSISSGGSKSLSAKEQHAWPEDCTVGLEENYYAPFLKCCFVKRRPDNPAGSGPDSVRSRRSCLPRRGS